MRRSPGGSPISVSFCSCFGNFAIRQNSNTKGIVIGKEETKLLQYADDTTAILGDTNSPKTLFELLDLFHVKRTIAQKRIEGYVDI